MLAVVMAFAFAGCGGGSGAPAAGGDSGAATADAPLKIGVIQVVEHDALSASRQGFIDALADNGYKDGENITLNIQVGSGDVSNLSTIADQLIAEKSDLILAIATPSAQAVAGKTTDIPILGTAITDYQVAGLVDDVNAPGGNISGTTDMNPVSEQIDLLIKLVPNAKTIGFIYSSNEDNSRVQIDLAKAAVEAKGLKWEEVTIANSNDVQQATTSIVSKVDALYLPTDNVLASTMPTVSTVANEAQIPIICAEQGMVENGGLATQGINYYDLGYQTGLMAVKVLKGEKVGSLPIEGATKFEYYLNAATADQIGITIPDDLKQYAH
jgi:putative ABC transport system substrate-binding protein